MVIVEIKLAPKGDLKQVRTIGIATIANDKTGDGNHGNYLVQLSHSGRFFGKEGIWRRGRVTGWNRNKSPYHLVLEALKSALPYGGR